MTVVDTPGFSFSKGSQINELFMNEMMSVLINKLKSANAIVILIRAPVTKFDDAFQQAIQNMIYLFGHSFWKIVLSPTF